MSTPVSVTWDGSHLNFVGSDGSLLFQADGAAREILSVGLTGQETLTITPAQLNVLVARINSLRSYLADGMLAIATITVSAVSALKFKTTTTAIYTISGAAYSVAATDEIVFTTAGTINVAGAGTTAHWGAWLVQVDAAGSVTTKAVGGGTTDQDYATEALAIAALPDATADNCALGYITVQGLASTAWEATTSNLTVGAGAGNCTARSFYNLPAAKTLPAAIA